jgi:hypothetical protein
MDERDEPGIQILFIRFIPFIHVNQIQPRRVAAIVAMPETMKSAAER